MGGIRKTDGDAGSTSPVSDLFRNVRSIYPRMAGEAKPVNKEKMLFNFFLIDLIVCAIRIAIAIFSNSMAMYTTAARAVISILTAFIAWICMRFASKDENHAFNYGYGKLESISSTVKGAALLISFILIVYIAIGRLSNPGKLTPVGAEIAIAFSLFFTCGNIYRWLRIRRILSNGERSPVLWSQYKATNASIIVNAGSLLSVLASVLLAGFWFGPYIDPVMSIFLSGFILIFAYSILSSSMTDLLDKTLDESIQLLIVRSLAEFFDEYTQIIGVRSRQSGGMIFVEITLEFEAGRSMGDVQSVVDRMQRSLEAKIQNSRITIVPRSAAVEIAAPPETA
ncbi:MAG TPA: cation diffusion facilitator family transporter [Methanocella sp.]|jgi:cation diffusion facilitator family transporter